MADDTSPRREAAKVWHALLLELLYLPFYQLAGRRSGVKTGRASVSLGIFEVVPEDRYPSREDRDRDQPKLDADGFDDMKLHITETEEASPNQGEAED
ncbi:hypothetical protein HX899_05315 [Rhizobium sp. WYCCWR 11146]|nr:hypothetical protein [Rhizobium sp. WYCCWR 11146]MBA1344721.1 hypothetical protein [Rhizobium sp. WYCCWR 11146]